MLHMRKLRDRWPDPRDIWFRNSTDDIKDLVLFCHHHCWPLPQADGRKATALPEKLITQKYLKKKTPSFFVVYSFLFLRSFPADLSSHFGDWLMLGHMSIPELITDKNHILNCELGAVERRTKLGFCQERRKKQVGR